MLRAPAGPGSAGSLANSHPQEGPSRHPAACSMHAWRPSAHQQASCMFGPICLPYAPPPSGPAGGLLAPHGRPQLLTVMIQSPERCSSTCNRNRNMETAPAWSHVRACVLVRACVRDRRRRHGGAPGMVLVLAARGRESKTGTLQVLGVMHACTTRVPQVPWHGRPRKLHGWGCHPPSTMPT